jgi:hypothetical protein
VNPLASLQEAMAEAIRNVLPCAQDDRAGAVLDLVAPSHRGMRPIDRLEVYREQFWLRHLSNLEEDYPTVVAVLGAPAFRELTTQFLRAVPPRTWNLERLGEDLPSFMQDDARRPELSELARDSARLDWAFMEAFGAPDVPPFDERVLALTAEDRWPFARIALTPSVRTLALSYAVHELREQLQKGAPAGPAREARTHLVVWRDRACYLRAIPVDPAALELLDLLSAGTPLGASCERVAQSLELGEAELGPRIAQWFQQWTANGWLRSIDFPTE